MRTPGLVVLGLLGVFAPWSCLFGGRRRTFACLPLAIRSRPWLTGGQRDSWFP